MRSHLLKCLHNGVLIEFPSKPEQRKSVFYKGVRPILSHYTALAECQRMILCSSAPNANNGSIQAVKKSNWMLDSWNIQELSNAWNVAQNDKFVLYMYIFYYFRLLLNAIIVYHGSYFCFIFSWNWRIYHRINGQVTELFRQIMDIFHWLIDSRNLTRNNNLMDSVIHGHHGTFLL